MAEAQTKLSYIYKSATSESITTLVGSDSVKLYNRTKVKPGMYETPVHIGNDKYVFAYDKSDKSYFFKDEAGEQVAQIGSSKKFYDITLTDGTIYDWKKVNGKKWTYSKDGKEILSGSLEKVNGKRGIVYSIADPAAEGLTYLLIASHLYGVDTIKRRSTRPFVYGTMFVLAIFSAATAEPSGPTVQ